ncbi:Stk1 family PASTA domain-containing Ser/Thr kinase [Caldibacillus lycopersici]|uniref:Serine/threonine-protein kinase PrkC n=1 Tax=Perspicuibacillus lycopersici TaxID=1325689 RepID=A0AAE3IPE5_9BACI|nr:Stk1 family PASTA domain-containing Ser/Thr kinase [Perspicuibacillus lycopersici]
MLIGKRINDRYKLIEKIGGGGMADVYLARDVILERYVAVKILRLDFANDEDFIRRFHREAQSATSLVHPNIVNIYDVGEEDPDIYYIVMEYVNGETLKQFIQNHSPLGIDKAIDIMKQLTSAIQHAHQNNIIHRDIKPQNVLIDKKGNVKITDFGIAMALTSTTITHTNTMLGSVHYISPEQARGGIATKKSDIYSLGIVLFEMLTGRLPFSGESAVSIALKHLQDETPSPKKWNPLIPQSVENIILKATAKDPFYRYQDVGELEEDLRTCLDENRINEPRFEIPVDEEATKAIPIISDERGFNQLQDTVIRDSQPNKIQEGLPKEEEPKKKKRKKWPIVLLSLSALIIILGILTLTVFPSLFGPDDIKVPDVTNLTLDEAIDELESAGFTIGKTTEMASEEIEKDHIIRTDPKAGRLAVEGSEINLYVSTGLETEELPDFKDRAYEDVLAILQSQSRPFKDIKVEEVYDESEAGTIIEQDPEPGTAVIPEETVITFTVSKGKETFALANLTEYPQNALKDYASSNGITINISGEEYHETIPKGYVISQDVEAGTQITKGTTVNVVISKGKEELPPKNVTVDIAITYTGNSEENQVQNVQIFIEDMNREITDPYEVFTITEDTRRLIDLVIAPGTKGRYKVVIDNEVVQDYQVDYPE